MNIYGDYMPKKNDNSKAKRSNRLIGTRTLYSFLFIVVVAIIVLISKNLYESKVEEYKSNIYKKLSSNIVDKFDVMLHEKMNTSILISSSLSKNTNIKKALMTNNTARLNMSKLLDEMKTSKEYVDIQAELIDADGISFKRSWTHHSGDDLVENDPKLAHLIKYPRVSTDIDASSYGLTISNKIPIYDNEDFLGLFGVNIHFDALVDIFSNEGFNSVIILNKDDSKKIFQEISYSKKFVGDCYVVNSNADDYLVKIIKNNLTDYCGKIWDENYKINESTDHLVTYYSIKDASGMEIAKAIIFKSIEQIDFEDLEFIEQTHIIATAIIIVLFGFLINYLYVVRAIKELKIENEELLHENNDLQTKTDEMDFNDKKLENLFNMQPNLMFMHNGREVTKANKRFMGFFNRFGTFDGFKKKHKCVSELFEEYKAPNYIWEQKIDNLFWIEYMLKNPRRLYKTVMSINGEPHHFIIKFNEMEYAQHVAERLIIVALVDMTQDLVNYKTLDESSQVLNMLGNNLELKEEKGNTDISYELQEQISLTLSDLIKKEITEKQIIKSNTQGLKGHNVIKVQGVLRFTDVESDWMFFIPAETASKILNYMMGDPDARTEGNVTKDNIDTARELISIISTKLCNEINNKSFHDLKDARYTESTIHEVSKKEIDTLENIYKIKVKLDDDFEVEFFTTFLDDIVPFLQQAANEKTIEVPKKVYIFFFVFLSHLLHYKIFQKV
jgi:chemotaxis protein CheY-P-specific phosphatase CheC/DNA-binding Lrp family transcriptional regulator